MTTTQPPDRDPHRESMEQIVSLARGPQGEAGQEGQAGVQGEPGRSLPKAQRQAITWMFAVCMALVAVLFLVLFHYSRELAGQQHVVSAQQKALDRQQKELDAAVAANFRQRCASLEQIARIPVPHPVAHNPSREWEAAYEAIERTRGLQLNCPGAK